jgi:hypothetical protein
MTYSLIRGDTLHLPLADDSVDLICTSPPYWALRSYEDGGEHYDGQIGSEPSPLEYLDVMVAVTREWVRVLKPSGSLWVNLGDKMAGSGSHNNATLSGPSPASTLRGNGHVGGGPKAQRRSRNRDAVDAARRQQRTAPKAYSKATEVTPGVHVRRKSLLGLPWRYALRVVDELGLILRAEVVWDKPNCIPESVSDRVSRRHEQWFHFTLSERYWGQVDEIREPHADGTAARYAAGYGDRSKTNDARQSSNYDLGGDWTLNPLGRAPGSVWSVPSEPLILPDELAVDHFAAYPSEFPRRIVTGWTTTGYCTNCGQARRPVVEKQLEPHRHNLRADNRGARNGDNHHDWSLTAVPIGHTVAMVTGYVCGCPTPDAPTRSAVVLDPFSGTGTTAAVAHLLGRHGIGVEYSADYMRVAAWRCSSDRRLRDRVLTRSGIPNPKPPKVDGQMSLEDLL